jgi:hypothetical protein
MSNVATVGLGLRADGRFPLVVLVGSVAAVSARAPSSFEVPR